MPAGRASSARSRPSSWARSRPCVVVGAEPAMRRPAGLLDPRRRRAAAAGRPAFEALGVFPALSSSSPGVDVLGGAPPPRRRRGRASRGGPRRPSTASCRTSPRPPRLCCSVARPRRRRPARRSTTSTSSRATAVGLVARLLYALVAPGLAYIRCVENGDDLRPVLELPVGPQNAPFCSFRCRASERSMCGAWGGCEKARFGEVQFGAAASARRWRRRQCAKYFLCLITPYSGGGRPPTRRLCCAARVLLAGPWARVFTATKTQSDDRKCCIRPYLAAFVD